MTKTDKAKGYAKHLVSRFKDDDLPSLGAQLTYYLILSFFPFLIFLVSIASFFQMSGDSVLNEFIRILPADTGSSLRKFLAETAANRSGTVLSLGMLGTLWAASNGVNAMIKGLNKAYDENESRPFWKVRLISILATLVLAGVFLVSLLLLVLGDIMGGYIFRFLKFPGGFPVIWDILQVAVPVVAMFGVFLLMYRSTPDRKLTWREVFPGAAFTTVGWIASSLLFSLYVNHLGNYSITYGSLGGIIILLVWLYWSSIMILIGGEINATLAFDKEGKTTRPSPINNHSMQLPASKGRSGAT